MIGLLAILGAGCGTVKEKGEAPKTGDASVNGTTLAYERLGRGPAVVFVHGGGFDRRLWDDQVEAFAEHFTVIRYDVRGSGASGRADGGAFTHHDDLAALLRHLGVARASVVGQSLGGRIAMDLALAQPDLVDRLVLVGPGLSGWPWSTDDFGPWLSDFRAAVAARDTAGAVEAWLGSDYMRAGMERPSLQARIRALALHNAGAWFQESAEEELAPPAAGRLADVRAPTLIVLGDRDERVIARITDTLLVHLPHARRAVIEGVGHAPNLEEPGRFNRLVLDFLRRKDE